jgi:hypothetical protein
MAHLRCTVELDCEEILKNTVDERSASIVGHYPMSV